MHGLASQVAAGGQFGVVDLTRGAGEGVNGSRVHIVEVSHDRSQTLRHDVMTLSGHETSHAFVPRFEQCYVRLQRIAEFADNLSDRHESSAESSLQFRRRGSREGHHQ